MRTLNKVDKSPGGEVFGYSKKSLKLDIRHREKIFCVSKKFIRNLIDYFFMIIDLGAASFGNGSLHTQLKDNAPLIEHFGPMYIDFDEYPSYSGRISE